MTEDEFLGLEANIPRLAAQRRLEDLRSGRTKLPLGDADAAINHLHEIVLAATESEEEAQAAIQGLAWALAKQNVPDSRGA